MQGSQDQKGGFHRHERAIATRDAAVQGYGSRTGITINMRALDCMPFSPGDESGDGRKQPRSGPSLGFTPITPDRRPRLAHLAPFHGPRLPGGGMGEGLMDLQAFPSTGSYPWRGESSQGRAAEERSWRIGGQVKFGTLGRSCGAGGRALPRSGRGEEPKKQREDSQVKAMRGCSSGLQTHASLANSLMARRMDTSQGLARNISKAACSAGT